MRLVDADDVIKAVDKHTKDDTEIVLDEDISCILEEVPTIARIDAIDNERMFLYKWRIDNKNPEYFPDKIKINKGLLTAIQELKGRAD